MDMKYNLLGGIYSASVIYLDHVDEGDCSGAFRNLYEDGEVPFQCVMNLVLGLEQKMNDISWPQHFFRLRRWKEPPKKRERAPFQHPLPRPRQFSPVPVRSGKKATFFLYVYTRQHASWQGKLHWVEAGKCMHFRSTLELLGLIHETLYPAGPESVPGTVTIDQTAPCEMERGEKER